MPPSRSAPERAKVLEERRIRNRLSAAAHRARKNTQIEDLEKLVDDLRAQNDLLRSALQGRIAHSPPDLICHPAVAFFQDPTQNTIQLPAA